MKKLNGYRLLLNGEVIKEGDEFTACGNSVNLPPHNKPGSRGWLQCLSGLYKTEGWVGHTVRQSDIDRGHIHRRPIFKDILPRPQTRRAEIATAIQVASREKRTAHETAAIISRIIDKHAKRAKRRAGK